MTTRDEAMAIAYRINQHTPPDLGIARTLAALIDKGTTLGIRMVESCDGSPGHSYNEPTIRFMGSAGAAWHAVGICLDLGFPLAALTQNWHIGPKGPDGPPTWDLIFRESVREGLKTPDALVYFAEFRDRAEEGTAV